MVVFTGLGRSSITYLRWGNTAQRLVKLLFAISPQECVLHRSNPGKYKYYMDFDGPPFL